MPLNVSDVMTMDPATIQTTATVGEAIRELEALTIRHLPVLDGQALAGMVSDRDLRPLVDEDDHFARPVTEVMATDLVTVLATDSLGRAVDLILAHRVGALPVVDAGRFLVGIVSYMDLLEVLRGRL